MRRTALGYLHHWGDPCPGQLGPWSLRQRRNPLPRKHRPLSLGWTLELVSSPERDEAGELVYTLRRTTSC